MLLRGSGLRGPRVHRLLGGKVAPDPLALSTASLSHDIALASLAQQRDKALREMPGLTNGASYEYVCCQGYVPKICCFDFPNWCRGREEGLVWEGCCCPILSLSITRVFVMDKLSLRPDPGDFQLIRLSNCLQLLSCICHILALFSRVSTGCGGVSVCD